MSFWGQLHCWASFFYIFPEPQTGFYESQSSVRPLGGFKDLSAPQTLLARVGLRMQLGRSAVKHGLRLEGEHFWWRLSSWSFPSPKFPFLPHISFKAHPSFTPYPLS